MALCSLCRTIPWTSLPQGREPTTATYVASNSEMLEVFHDWPGAAAKDTETQEPSGLPFHANLDALARSAKECALCALVQTGVQKWIDSWEDAAKNNKGFIEFSMNRQPLPENEQLWVTKSHGGLQGFYVWAENARSKGRYLLAAIGFSADRNHALSEKFPVRPLQLSSGSAQSLDLVASWVKDCSSNHEQCIVRDIPLLPTRIVDVGLSGDTVKLLDGEDRRGLYVCLSYCWGDYPHYTTTKDKLDQRRSGCSLSEMPQTFVDAITITRHLGIRYIWIDSLCICQDDWGDWAREAACMSEVYSKAHLIIAANRSADCSGGCFHTREQRAQASVNILRGMESIQATLLFQSDQQWSFTTAEFRSEELPKRGWALQERLLAKKVIHYNSRQMYFECNRGIVAEDGSSVEPRYGHSFLQLVANPIYVTPTYKGMQQNPSLHEGWSSVLWAYGMRTLSRPSDKLPAMSGLARLFHNQTMLATYVAGLWSDSMLKGIAWQGLKGQAPYGEYTGPSWSWASYDGIAAMQSDHEGWKDVATVRDWHVELENYSNPYGEVKPGAWVKIHGPVIGLELSTTKTTEHENRLQRAQIAPLPRLCTRYSEDPAGTMMTPDHIQVRTSAELQHWDLRVMILRGRGSETKENTYDNVREDGNSRPFELFYGLVIRTSNRGQYTEKAERIGWMFFERVEGYKIVEDSRNWGTVVLV